MFKYHDASFSMKLTDIMFNLDYIAANTGADVEYGVGEIFARETVKALANNKIKLAAMPVALNEDIYVWYRLANDKGDMRALKLEAPDQEITLPILVDEGQEVCVMYRKAADGKKITISSQFIPESLHAILSVALYAGDSCDVESATKAGEVVIDIPRLQLSGAMDITMSATGAAQTPLEGNALASGCVGCDGKAIYATITQVIDNHTWKDDVQSIFIEDAEDLVCPEGQSIDLFAYAAFGGLGAPKKLDDAVWSSETASAITAAGHFTRPSGNNDPIEVVVAWNGFSAKAEVK